MKRMIGITLCLVLALCIVSASCFTVFAEEYISEPPYEEIIEDADNLAAVGVEKEAAFTAVDSELIVPQIRITTEEGNGASLQKDDGYVDAVVTITDTDGSVLSDTCSFKVRGNTTAMTFVQKKAYTFKFEKKKDVLGMGKGKKWALLANAFDPTLLRNYMANEFARHLELPYTSEHRIVEVIVDDSYRGCYELYEPIQEGKDRVNIDIESNDGKQDFLIEYEAQRVEEDTTYFTIDGLRFIASDPDEPDDDQLQYIVDTMTQIINTLKNGSREEIEAVIDVPSFSKFYLLNEYLKTFDFDMSSVFFFYQDGKLYAGPAWDYDMSTGNTNADLNSSRAKATAASDGILQNNRNIYKHLCNKSWFMDEVKQVYEENYDYMVSISADGGLLDTWSNSYMELFTRNASVWTWSRWWYNYQKKPLPTYAENMNYLKNWLNERNAWLYDYFDLFSYEFLRGDADGNGAVESIDATCIQRALVGLHVVDDGKIAIRAAMKDNELNITDVTVLQRYLAKMGNPYQLDTVCKVKLR